MKIQIKWGLHPEPDSDEPARVDGVEMVVAAGDTSGSYVDAIEATRADLRDPPRTDFVMTVLLYNSQPASGRACSRRRTGHGDRTTRGDREDSK